MKKRILKTISISILLVMLLSTIVLAESKYFTIEIPKDYLVIDKTEGQTKLNTVRKDGKVNFNIQVIQNLDEYFEYSDQGLKELIETTKKETAMFTINDIKGEISKIAEYPCYSLSYEAITKDNNPIKLYIKQMFIYEDTYTYLITLGGASPEMLEEAEIQGAMKSFKLVKYDRNNVRELKDKKQDKEVTKNTEENFITKISNSIKKIDKTTLLIISIVLAVVALIIICLIIMSLKKRAKNKVNGKTQNKVNNKANSSEEQKDTDFKRIK